MTRKARALTRSLAVTAIAATAGLGLAVPAYAHPEITLLHCESGNAMILCDVFLTGEAPPVDLKWYLNNNLVPAYEDKQSILFRCSVGQFVSVKVVATDANGSDTKTRSVRCNAIWP